MGIKKTKKNQKFKKLNNRKTGNEPILHRDDSTSKLGS